MKKITLTFPGQNDYFVQEAFKTLRTNILFCGNDIKTVGFTSSIENEGKTTVVLGIARSFAELGKRVLVLDSDMRKSVLAGRNTDVDNPTGLSEVLTGMSTLGDSICSTQYPGLDILFAGKYPPNPVELLNGKYFGASIEALKKVYNYIFIDTAPLGRVIDASVVATQCDGMVIVIGNSKVHSRQIQDVVCQLKRSNCPILGVVRNKVQCENNTYYSKKYKA